MTLFCFRQRSRQMVSDKQQLLLAYHRYPSCLPRFCAAHRTQIYERQKAHEHQIHHPSVQSIPNSIQCMDCVQGKSMIIIMLGFFDQKGFGLVCST